MEQEFEALGSEKHVRQGDVIQWHDRAFKRPWNTYGVVVTADCDLVWGKYRGRISYVPALLTEDYLWTNWRLEEFQSGCATATNLMTLRLNACIQKNDQSRLPVSTDAMIAWANRVGSAELLRELGVNKMDDFNRLKLLIDNALSFYTLLNMEEPNLEHLRHCHNLLKPSATGDDKLIADVQKALSQLPGDVFHLPALHDRDNDGLFLMLRHISQCDVQDVAIHPDDLRFGNAKAKRVARVSAPYRYAITQCLAKVFADIGLPSQYTERCKGSAARFFQARARA